jgi:hypothetical protein
MERRRRRCLNTNTIIYLYDFCQLRPNLHGVMTVATKTPLWSMATNEHPKTKTWFSGMRPSHQGCNTGRGFPLVRTVCTLCGRYVLSITTHLRSFLVLGFEHKNCLHPSKGGVVYITQTFVLDYEKNYFSWIWWDLKFERFLFSIENQAVRVRKH